MKVVTYGHGIIASIFTYLVQDVVTAKTSIEVYNNSTQKIQELLIQTAKASAQASTIGQKMKETESEVSNLKRKISAADLEIVGIVQKTKNSASLLESNKQIAKIVKQLSENEAFSKKISIDKELPIGAILPSMGDSKSLKELSAKSIWVPADGRPIPKDSLYTKITGSTTVPDLRGMFLRGLNAFGSETPIRSDGLEDPQGDRRKPGSYQADTFLSHHHHGGYPAHLASRYGIENGLPSPPGTRYDFSDSQGPVGWKQAAKTNSVGSLETRSKNISIFYYIKIN
jgi:hypothetical protein